MDDWLDIEPADPDTEIAKALISTATPTAGEPVDQTLPEKAKALILALRVLKPRQRMWLRTYVYAGGNKTRAQKILERRGDRPPDRHTILTWERQPQYAHALELLRHHAASNAGLDEQSLLIRAGIVLDDALTPKPVVDRDGFLTGEETIDGQVAMRAIEWMGKVRGMVKDDTGARTTLVVVNMADRDVIDVTPVAEQ